MGRFRGGRVFKPTPNFMSMGIGLRHSSSSFALADLLGTAATTHVVHGFRVSTSLQHPENCEEQISALQTPWHKLLACVGQFLESVLMQNMMPSRRQLTLQSLRKACSYNLVGLQPLSHRSVA